MNLNKELDIAIIAARKAGNFLDNQKSNLNKVILDEEKDIKLIADVETENLIKKIITESSDYPILAEESGSSVKDLGDIFWVIDPLDGTANFSRNLPVSCVSIALLKKNEPILGVINDFNNNNIYSGSIMHKAKMNETQIYVSKVNNKKSGILATGLPAKTDFSKESLKRMISDLQSWKKVRMIGSAAMSSVYVASGVMDMYKEHKIYLWDIAAGAAIVKAAGGKVSLINLRKNYQVDAFFSNQKLKDEHN